MSSRLGGAGRPPGRPARQRSSAAAANRSSPSRARTCSASWRGYRRSWPGIAPGAAGHPAGTCGAGRPHAGPPSPATVARRALSTSLPAARHLLDTTTDRGLETRRRVTMTSRRGCPGAPGVRDRGRRRRVRRPPSTPRRSSRRPSMGPDRPDAVRGGRGRVLLADRRCEPPRAAPIAAGSPARGPAGRWTGGPEAGTPPTASRSQMLEPAPRWRPPRSPPPRPGEASSAGARLRRARGAGRHRRTRVASARTPSDVAPRTPRPSFGGPWPTATSSDGAGSAAPRWLTGAITSRAGAGDRRGDLQRADGVPIVDGRWRHADVTRCSRCSTAIRP